MRLWDAKNGAPIGKLEGHTSSIYSVNFSPDGRTVVSGSREMTLRIWDVRPDTLDELDGTPISDSDDLSTTPTSYDSVRENILHDPNSSDFYPSPHPWPIIQSVSPCSTQLSRATGHWTQWGNPCFRCPRGAAMASILRAIPLSSALQVPRHSILIGLSMGPSGRNVLIQTPSVSPLSLLLTMIIMLSPIT